MSHGAPTLLDSLSAAAERIAPRHRTTAVRVVRYSAVSVVSTTTSLVTLGVLVGLAGMPAGWSNVIATAIGTVPSFELNRRWVWSDAGPRSWLRQVVPFCALSFAGLVLSTITVSLVGHATAGWSRLDHTVAVELANVAAYGTLWVIQYQLLNRFLFVSDHDQPESDTTIRPGEAGPGEADGPDADHDPAAASGGTAVDRVSVGVGSGSRI
jgi:putative flippase GtrA